MENLERRTLLAAASVVAESVYPFSSGELRYDAGHDDGETDEHHEHDAFCGNDLPYAHEDLHFPTDGPEYQIGGRWSTTASGSAGTSGQGVTLTWGFVPDGTTIPNGVGEPTAPSNLIASLNAKYGSQANWLPLFQMVFDAWSAKTGITYVYESSDDGASFPSSSGVLGVRADVRISGKFIDGASNILAYNRFPNAGGDMVLDTAEFNGFGFFASTFANSRNLRNVVAHEHGHGVGLAHVDPINGTKLMEAFASNGFDMMQFDDYLGAIRNYGDRFEKGGFGNNGAPVATDRGTLNNVIDTLNELAVSNTNDRDYFKFTLADTRRVSITITPIGPTYLQGPQGGSTGSFNASAQMDLQVQLIGSDGTTVLQTANNTGLGFAESITNQILDPGDYFIRVSNAPGTSGTAQMYTLSTNVTTEIANGIWDGQGDGLNWHDPANWSNNVVPGVNDDVVISLPGDVTVQITSGSAAVRSLLSEENLVVSGGSLSVAQSATIDGSFTLSGGTFTGNGNLTLNTTSNSWNGGTFAGSGKLVIQPGAALNVGGAAGLRSSDREIEILGDLNLVPGSGVVLKTKIFNLGAGATLDLGDNAAIFDYDDDTLLPVVRSAVINGYAGGTWSGTGITSSLAAANTSHAVGYAEASGVFSSFPGSFLGQQVDSSAVLLRYTRYGDADLSGQANLADFNRLAGSFGQSNTAWSQGNFNFDNTTNLADFNLLASNFGQSASPAAATYASTSTRAATDSTDEREDQQPIV